MNDGEGGAIGSPGGIFNIVEQIAGSVSADGKLGEGTDITESVVGHAKPAQDSHLSSGRDGEHQGLRQTEIAGFGGIRGTDEDGFWRTFPGRAVDGGARVGSKAGGGEGAAA